MKRDPFDHAGTVLECHCGGGWTHRSEKRESYVCPHCGAGPKEHALIALRQRASAPPHDSAVENHP